MVIIISSHYTYFRSMFGLAFWKGKYFGICKLKHILLQSKLNGNCQSCLDIWYSTICIYADVKNAGVIYKHWQDITQGLYIHYTIVYIWQAAVQDRCELYLPLYLESKICKMEYNIYMKIYINRYCIQVYICASGIKSYMSKPKFIELHKKKLVIISTV